MLKSISKNNSKILIIDNLPNAKAPNNFNQIDEEIKEDDYDESFDEYEDDFDDFG
jgi:hypothetical protein